MPMPYMISRMARKKRPRVHRMANGSGFMPPFFFRFPESGRMSRECQSPYAGIEGSQSISPAFAASRMEDSGRMAKPGAHRYPICSSLL
eukprot:scaffold7404_cov286-Pinguiococcus_pyrenoidosus.AAC.1